MILPDRASNERRVVEALRKAGVEVTSIYDLVNTDKRYPTAIPVLVRLLSEEFEDNIKEGIVRALAVREAQGVAAPALIAEFRRITGSSPLKWAIGNALEEVADDSVFGDLARLVRERGHGESRQMVVLALGRMKDPRADDVLIDLLEDEEVVGHAIIALGRLGSRKARGRIERFLHHPMPWIRAEAKRAIARIERAQRRGESKGH